MIPVLIVLLALGAILLSLAVLLLWAIREMEIADAKRDTDDEDPQWLRRLDEYNARAIDQRR